MPPFGSCLPILWRLGNCFVVICHVQNWTIIARKEERMKQELILMCVEKGNYRLVYEYQWNLVKVKQSFCLDMLGATFDCTAVFFFIIPEALA